MQQAVCDAPLLLPADQRDCLVVEPDNPAASLLMVAIDEANQVTDRHLVSSQTLYWLFPDFDVGAVEVDGHVRNQPALLGGQIEDNRLLAPQLDNLSLMGSISWWVKIFDGLANVEP